MYTQIFPKDAETYQTLLADFDIFRSGVKSLLEDFGIPPHDSPVEPPSQVVLPFRPDDVPNVVFVFTTSRLEENADFPNMPSFEKVVRELAIFVEKFVRERDIKRTELWFRPGLVMWSEIIDTGLTLEGGDLEDPVP